MKNTVLRTLRFALAGCALLAVYTFVTLPDPARIKECLTTEFKKVSLCPKEPQYVPLNRISKVARAAILISEDSRFYAHQGFDWLEMRKSAEKNWAQQGFRRGGSTITQQLAKNVFLTGEKSIVRKLKEAYLTWRLEQILTKDQILEKYLNVVELGPNIFGIKAAAKHYFGKSPSELNAAESSFLAMLLPNPVAYYASFRQKKLTPFARKRVREVSKKMLLTSHISDWDYQSVVASLDGFPWRGGLNTPVPVSELEIAEDLTIEPDADYEADYEPEVEL